MPTTYRWRRANRIGTEDELTFYGSSFVVDHRGRPLAQAGRDTEETIYAELDFARAAAGPGRVGAVPRSAA